MNGLNHIAIAVENLDSAIEHWTKTFSFILRHREVVESQKSEVALLERGELKIELISPTSDDSPVSKFLKTRGEGLHHIALTSSNADAELARLRDLGIRLINETSRPGVEGTRVGFVHPKSLNGVLVEIVENPHS